MPRSSSATSPARTMLHVPEVHWDLCRQERHGHGAHPWRARSPRSRNCAELGTDIPKLAENGVEIFFTQVFRHNFFHADMHPGNIFVDVSDPANPRYAAVDFGIVGTLDPRDQLYLAGNFLAFFERDYRRVAVLHLESGWVPAGTRVDELESAVRTVCEPIFDKPLKDISFGVVLLHLFDIARRYEMQVQPQLILLQKTLLNIEGLGRQLYPELDLWKTALPILREWMQERSGPRAVLGSLREHWPDIAEAIKVLPVIARRAIRRAYDDELVVRTESESLEKLRVELRRNQRRGDTILAAGVVFLGGIIWLALATQPTWIGWLLAGRRSGLDGESTARWRELGRLRASRLAGERRRQAVDQLHEVFHVVLIIVVVQEADSKRSPAVHARGRKVRFTARADGLRNSLVERIERRLVQAAIRRPVSEIHH